MKPFVSCDDLMQFVGNLRIGEFFYGLLNEVSESVTLLKD